MLYTAKVSYGVRALIDLAREMPAGSPVPVRRISERQEISSVYLEQIFNRLKRSGIVRSIRGPQGGYVLADKASEISVLDVVLALEGSIFPGRCPTSGTKKGKVCEKADICAFREVWGELEQNIERTLRKYTIEDLMDKTGSLIKEQG
jgi:Rrf2 family protein